jgi:uncharacterized protein (DUF2237 family)
MTANLTARAAHSCGRIRISPNYGLKRNFPGDRGCEVMATGFAHALDAALAPQIVPSTPSGCADP